MPNPFIPRLTVHDWSEKIGQDPSEHQAALTRLLKDQRRLSKFIEENRESMDPATSGVTVYLVGVIARMFDLAGGRLRGATWEQVRDVSAKVGAEVESLLPADASFVERARGVSWRAQPHILDEALMALFQRETAEGETDLPDAEKVKVYLLLWVATEVLDQNWKTAPGYTGDTSYTDVHLEPKKA